MAVNIELLHAEIPGATKLVSKTCGFFQLGEGRRDGSNGDLCQTQARLRLNKNQVSKLLGVPTIAENVVRGACRDLPDNKATNHNQIKPKNQNKKQKKTGGKRAWRSSRRAAYIKNTNTHTHTRSTRSSPPQRSPKPNHTQNQHVNIPSIRQVPTSVS